MYNASCLCGEITLTAKTIIGDYVYCHCTSCRKSSGSAHGANVSIPIEGFEISSGKNFIKMYESSPGKIRHFCGKCGSPLFTKVGESPDVIRLRLGCLDSDYKKTASAHIFTGDKAVWDVIDNEIPQFESWPSKDAVEINGSHQPDE